MKRQKLWIRLTVVLLVLVKTITMEPQWYNTADGQKYLIDTEEKYNWYEAWNECARYDAQLIVIDSLVKNYILKKLLNSLSDQGKYLWTGGNVVYEKIILLWAPTKQEFTFMNWLPDAVNKFVYKERCVYLMRQHIDYPWNITTCDYNKFGFICEEMLDSAESSEKAENLKGIRVKNNGNMYSGSIYGLIG